MKITWSMKTIATVICLLVIGGALITAKGFRQGGMHGRMGGRASMGGGMAAILEEAGVPLTEDQIAHFESLERGPESREERQSILTDEQKEALEAARAERGGRKGMRGGMGGGMAAILEEAGVPLTEDQIAQIESLERGPESREERQSILTDEQKEALEAARAERGGRKGMRGGMKGKHGGRGKRFGITSLLEEAGVPLTESQIEQLKAITHGSDARDQVASILTDKQKEVLKNHFIAEEPAEPEELYDSLEKPASVDEEPEAVTVLKQNYPNPFNPSTTIEYKLAQAGRVKIEVYGPNGQLVKTLVDQYQSAGQHTVTWNASSLAGGVYLCKIIAGDYTETVKMTYVK